MVIFEPFDIHYAESRESEYYERCVLNFREDIFHSIMSDSDVHLLTERINGCVMRLSEEQTEEMYGYFSRVDEYSEHDGLFAKKLLYTAVFQLILKAIEYSDGNVKVTGNQVEPNIIKALKYIDKHYNENISLDNISEAAHMSKFYFCRKFHVTTGATVLEYSIAFKIN